MPLKDVSAEASDKVADPPAVDPSVSSPNQKRRSDNAETPAAKKQRVATNSGDELKSQAEVIPIDKRIDAPISINGPSAQAADKGKVVKKTSSETVKEAPYLFKRTEYI